MNAWLLDTGPIIAVLDRGDSLHEEAFRALSGFSGQLYTTIPVITECMHFLSRWFFADFSGIGR